MIRKFGSPNTKGMAAKTGITVYKHTVMRMVSLRLVPWVVSLVEEVASTRTKPTNIVKAEEIANVVHWPFMKITSNSIGINIVNPNPMINHPITYPTGRESIIA